MTLYLVKKADGNVVLFDEQGDELFDAPETIKDSDSAEKELIEAYKSAYPNADLLSDSVRPYFVDIVSGNWVYLDLTIDGETVPW